MKTGLAGHRVDGYKWCCQGKIIIVLIRKRSKPGFKKENWQLSISWVVRQAWWDGGHLTPPLPFQMPASSLPRVCLCLHPGVLWTSVCGRGRLDLALMGCQRVQLGLFAGIRDHFQQEQGKTSISYCTWNTLWYVLNIMTTQGLAIIDSPTQPFSLRAVRFTNSTIF